MVSETDTGSHYFDERPTTDSSPRQIELLLPDLVLGLVTDSGVFSASRIDPGTRYLLQEMPPIPDSVATIADIGCGYGPIALACARRAPNATVWAVDVNARARELTATNADRNEITNVRVTDPGSFPSEVAIDLIVSNPPIRVGKEALQELLSLWLTRLSPVGAALLVVQKHLGSDSLQRWLTQQGWPTERLGSRQGYRILQVAAR